MSDHLDAPGGSPGMDPRLDICDVYVFKQPDDPDRTVLVLNVNPFAPSGADEFHPEAIYEVLIDTNSDARAEIAYRFTFSQMENRRQLANVHMARGDAVRDVRQGDALFKNVLVNFGAGANETEVGGHRLFIGMRSDPFFFDLAGYLNAMQFTGNDHFLDKNVFSVILEVPNEVFEASKIGVWARVLAPHEGDPLFQVDRMGHPFMNVAFIKDKDLFNHSEPAQDRELFADHIAELLASHGRDMDSARQEALRLLPDILEYKLSSPTRYPNGRTLSDDIIDHQLALITNGKITSDEVGPHDDLLDEFPYLGPPHPGQQTIEALAEASQRRSP